MIGKQNGEQSHVSSILSWASLTHFHRLSLIMSLIQNNQQAKKGSVSEIENSKFNYLWFNRLSPIFSQASFTYFYRLPLFQVWFRIFNEQTNDQQAK